MAESLHADLVLSGGLAVVWLILYDRCAGFRCQMLRVSIATMPLGLISPCLKPAGGGHRAVATRWAPHDGAA